jgi:hypothetical protein
LAGGIIASLAARHSHATDWRGILAGGLVGLLFGLAPIPWSQAVITEVHGLNALFVAVAFLLMAMLGQATKRRAMILGGLGLLSGIALGNHITFVLLLPAMVYAIVRANSGFDSKRSLLIWFGLLLVGLVGIYLYLPFAASANPPINWGDPSTWKGFWWVISGGTYRGLAFGLPIADILHRMVAWSGLLLDQFGVVGMVLGIGGVVYGRSRFQWLDRLSIWMVIVYSLFALGYDAADSDVYLIPAYLGFTWWIGLGLSAGMSLVGQFRRELPYVLLAFVLITTGIRLPGIWTRVDASTDHRASDFVNAIMEDTPPGALVLTVGTRDTFGLWYARFGLDERPDLTVVAVAFTQFEWYQRNLPVTYPAITFPNLDTSDMWLWVEELKALNDLPVCMTQEFDPNGYLDVDFHCD